jgi:hypothetical protein
MKTVKEKLVNYARNKYNKEEEYLACVDGGNFVKTENFGFGAVVGFMTALVLVCAWAVCVMALESKRVEENNVQTTETMLNSKEYRVDTVKTIVNADTTLAYKLTKIQ